MHTEQVLDGRYRLEDCLGVGGMSVVWRARDEVLGRLVAVKVLAGPYASDAGARQRIRAEAQAFARLWHPHVTSVFDYGEATGDLGECVPYVVMELLPGPTLAERLAEGPLAPRAALRICAEVAAGLAAAHAEDLVHCDVKPSNVMLTPSGAKVVDFGLAAVDGEPGYEVHGEMPGTPAYFAPERLVGDEVRPASDVYALGVLIHRALTNRLPWRADTPSQLLTAHAEVTPYPLPALPDVPPQVNDVYRRCLAKDPSDRPSADEVAAVLSAAAGMVPPPDVDATSPEGWTGVAPTSLTSLISASEVTPALAASAATMDDARRRRLVLVLAGVVVLAAVVALLALVQPTRRPDGTVLPPGAPAGESAAVTGPAVTAPTRVPGTQPVGPVGSASPRPGKSAVVSAQPTPGRSATPSAEPGVAFSALGGVVRVSCEGKKATVLGADPAPDYIIDVLIPGPADEIKVVFISTDHKSEVRVRCNEGVAVPEIKESSR